MWPDLAKHCPLCGTELAEAAVQGRRRKRCPACDFVLYKNPASAAAGLVLDASRRVLLIRRAIAPHKGDWALPAGYQEMDEDPRETVVREVREETGLEVEVLELLDLVFVSKDFRKPANLAIFHCRVTGGQLAPGVEALEAAWFALEQLPPNMGFDNGPLLLQRLNIP